MIEQKDRDLMKECLREAVALLESDPAINTSSGRYAVGSIATGFYFGVKLDELKRVMEGPLAI